MKRHPNHRRARSTGGRAAREASRIARIRGIESAAAAVGRHLARQQTEEFWREVWSDVLEPAR